MLRRVRPRSSDGVGAAWPFDEHFLDASNALAVPLRGQALDDLDEPLDPLALDVVRHLVGHRCGFGARTRRVDERESAVVADLLHDLERLAEVVLGLARKADDQVGAEREIRDRVAQPLDEQQVALAVVRSAHALEHSGRSRLQRQVHVLADGVALGLSRRSPARGSPSGAGS